MDKKIILALLLIVFSSAASADLLLNYEVSPTQVPLDQEIAISGKFVDDLNHSTNILCSYYITDANGIRLYRLSDTRTDMLGNFFQKLKMSEPRFTRGTDYNALTICDQGTATKGFLLGQRESIYHATLWEFGWLTNSDNLNTLFWFGGAAAIIILVIFGISRISKGINKRWG